MDVLEQDFLVTWRPASDGSLDNLELEFEGLSGSFVGEKGRPGVEYNTELGIYKADVCYFLKIKIFFCFFNIFSY